MKKRTHGEVFINSLIVYEDDKKQGIWTFKTEKEAYNAQKRFEEQEIELGFTKDEAFTDGHHFIREDW